MSNIADRSALGTFKVRGKDLSAACVVVVFDVTSKLPIVALTDTVFKMRVPNIIYRDQKVTLSHSIKSLSCTKEKGAGYSGIIKRSCTLEISTAEFYNIFPQAVDILLYGGPIANKEILTSDGTNVDISELKQTTVNIFSQYFFDIYLINTNNIDKEITNNFGLGLYKMDIGASFTENEGVARLPLIDILTGGEYKAGSWCRAKSFIRFGDSETTDKSVGATAQIPVVYGKAFRTKLHNVSQTFDSNYLVNRYRGKLRGTEEQESLRDIVIPYTTTEFRTFDGSNYNCAGVNLEKYFKSEVVTGPGGTSYLEELLTKPPYDNGPQTANWRDDPDNVNRTFVRVIIGETNECFIGYITTYESGTPTEFFYRLNILERSYSYSTMLARSYDKFRQDSRLWGVDMYAAGDSQQDYLSPYPNKQIVFNNKNAMLPGTNYFTATCHRSVVGSKLPGYPEITYESALCYFEIVGQEEVETGTATKTTVFNTTVGVKKWEPEQIVGEKYAASPYLMYERDGWTYAGSFGWDGEGPCISLRFHSTWTIVWNRADYNYQDSNLDSWRINGKAYLTSELIPLEMYLRDPLVPLSEDDNIRYLDQWFVAAIGASSVDISYSEYLIGSPCDILDKDNLKLFYDNGTSLVEMSVDNIDSITEKRLDYSYLDSFGNRLYRINKFGQLVTANGDLLDTVAPKGLYSVKLIAAPSTLGAIDDNVYISFNSTKSSEQIVKDIIKTENRLTFVNTNGALLVFDLFDDSWFGNTLINRDSLTTQFASIGVTLAGTETVYSVIDRICFEIGATVDYRNGKFELVDTVQSFDDVFNKVEIYNPQYLEDNSLEDLYNHYITKFSAVEFLTESNTELAPYKMSHRAVMDNERTLILNRKYIGTDDPYTLAKYSAGNNTGPAYGKLCEYAYQYLHSETHRKYSAKIFTGYGHASGLADGSLIINNLKVGIENIWLSPSNLFYLTVLNKLSERVYTTVESEQPIYIDDTKPVLEQLPEITYRIPLQAYDWESFNDTNFSNMLRIHKYIGQELDKSHYNIYNTIGLFSVDSTMINIGDGNIEVSISATIQNMLADSSRIGSRGGPEGGGDVDGPGEEITDFDENPLPDKESDLGNTQVVVEYSYDGTTWYKGDPCIVPGHGKVFVRLVAYWPKDTNADASISNVDLELFATWAVFAKEQEYVLKTFDGYEDIIMYNEEVSAYIQEWEININTFRPFDNNMPPADVDTQERVNTPYDLTVMFTGLMKTKYSTWALETWFGGCKIYLLNMSALSSLALKPTNTTYGV